MEQPGYGGGFGSLEMTSGGLTPMGSSRFGAGRGPFSRSGNDPLGLASAVQHGSDVKGQVLQLVERVRKHNASASALSSPSLAPTASGNINPVKHGSLGCHVYFPSSAFKPGLGACFSPERDLLLRYGYGPEVKVIKASDGHVFCTLVEDRFSGPVLTSPPEVLHAAFSPDSAHILISRDDNFVFIYTLNATTSGRPISYVLKADFMLSEPASFCAMAPDSRSVLVIKESGRMERWSVGGGVHPIVTYNTGQPSVAAAFASAGAVVVSCSDSWEVVRVGTNDGRVQSRHPFNLPHEGRKSATPGYAISRDGRWVVIYIKDQTHDGIDNLALFDGDHVTSFNAMSYVRACNGAVMHVAFSPDGSTFLVTGHDHAIQVYSTGGAVPRLQTMLQGGHLCDIESMCSTGPHAERPTLAISGDSDGAVMVWDADASQVLVRLQGHTSAVVTADISADGTRALTLDKEGHLFLWFLDLRGIFNIMHKEPDYLSACAMTRDGTRMVVGYEDRTLQLWAAEGGARRLWTHELHDAPVERVSISEGGPWGGMVASGSSDGTVMLTALDDDSANGMAGGTLLGRRDGHLDVVTALAFSADGRVLLSCARDGTSNLYHIYGNAAKLSDDRTSDPSAQPEPPTPTPGTAGGGDGVSNGLPAAPAAGPPSNLDHGRLLFLYEMRTPNDPSGITQCLLGPAGRYKQLAVMASQSGMVTAWDIAAAWDARVVATAWRFQTLETGGEVGPESPHALNDGVDGQPPQVPPGKAESPAKGGKDADGGPPPPRLRGWQDASPGIEVTALGFSADGSQLVAGSHDGSVLVMTLSGERLTQISGPSLWNVIVSHKQPMTGNSSGITHVYFDASESPVHVIGVGRRQAVAWHLPDPGAAYPEHPVHKPSHITDFIAGDTNFFLQSKAMPAKRTFVAHSGLTAFDPAINAAMYDMCLAGKYTGNSSLFRNGTTMLHAGVHRRELVLFSPPDRTMTIMDESGGHCCLDFSPCGKRLVTGNAKGELSVWDMVHGSLITPIRPETWVAHKRAAVTCVKFSHDGNQVYSCGEDKKVILWEWRQIRAVARLEAHASTVVSVDMALDGRRMVSGDKDGIVIIWDVATFQGQAVVAHDGPVLSCSITPDSSMVTCSGEDEQLCIIDCAKAQVVQRLGKALDGKGQVAKYSYDGKKLLIGGHKGDLLIWGVEEGYLLHAVRAHPKGCVYDCAWSGDNRRVLSVGADGRARLWEAAGGGELCQASYEDGFAVLSGGGFIKCDLSSDGSLMAGCTAKGHLIRWDVGRESHKLPNTQMLVEWLSAMPVERARDIYVRLLNAHPLLFNAQDNHGKTLLMHAAERSNTEIVKIIVSTVDPQRASLMLISSPPRAAAELASQPSGAERMKPQQDMVSCCWGHESPPPLHQKSGRMKDVLGAPLTPLGPNALARALASKSVAGVHQRLNAVLHQKVTRGSYIAITEALMDVADLYPEMCEAFLTRLPFLVLGEVAVPSNIAARGLMMRADRSYTSYQEIWDKKIQKRMDKDRAKARKASFFRQVLQKLKDRFDKKSRREPFLQFFKSLFQPSVKPPSMVSLEEEPAKVIMTAAMLQLPFTTAVGNRSLLHVLCDSQVGVRTYGSDTVRSIIMYKWRKYAGNTVFKLTLAYLTFLALMTAYAILISQDPGPPQVCTQFNSNYFYYGVPVNGGPGGSPPNFVGQCSASGGDWPTTGNGTWMETALDVVNGSVANMSGTWNTFDNIPTGPPCYTTPPTCAAMNCTRVDPKTYNLSDWPDGSYSNYGPSMYSGANIQQLATTPSGRAEIVLSFITCLMGMYFLLGEFAQLFKLGPFTYFSTFWNYLDLASYAIAVIIPPLVLSRTQMNDGQNGYVLVAAEIIMLWGKSFFYGLAVDGLGTFIYMIIEVIKGLKFFYGLVMVVYIAFGVALMNVNRTPPSGDQCYVSYPGYVTFGQALMSLYQSMFQNQPPISALGTLNPTSSIIVLCLATFLCNIVLINLIITLMSDLFSRIKEEQEFVFQKNRADLIIEVESSMIPKTMQKQRERRAAPYLHVLLPISQDQRQDDMEEGWGGDGPDLPDDGSAEAGAFGPRGPDGPGGGGGGAAAAAPGGLPPARFPLTRRVSLKLPDLDLPPPGSSPGGEPTPAAAAALSIAMPTRQVTSSKYDLGMRLGGATLQRRAADSPSHQGAWSSSALGGGATRGVSRQLAELQRGIDALLMHQHAPHLDLRTQSQLAPQVPQTQLSLVKHSSSSLAANFRSGGGAATAAAVTAGSGEVLPGGAATAVSGSGEFPSVSGASASLPAAAAAAAGGPSGSAAGVGVGAEASGGSVGGAPSARRLASMRLDLTASRRNYGARAGSNLTISSAARAVQIANMWRAGSAGLGARASADGSNVQLSPPPHEDMVSLRISEADEEGASSVDPASLRQ